MLISDGLKSLFSGYLLTISKILVALKRTRYADDPCIQPSFINPFGEFFPLCSGLFIKCAKVAIRSMLYFSTCSRICFDIEKYSIDFAPTERYNFRYQGKNSLISKSITTGVENDHRKRK